VARKTLNMNIKNSKFSQWIPPWMMIGVVIILLPIFTFITIKNINQEQTNYKYLMIEKGMAAIRAFGAGSIAGMMHMQWGEKERLKLISEIVKQSEKLSYLLITDTKGRIIAHNDPLKIGTSHFHSLDFANSLTRKAGWHIRKLNDGKEVFEVFRRLPHSVSSCFDDECKLTFPHMMGPKKRRIINKDDKIMFAGFDIKSIKSAKSLAAKRAIIMGSALLFMSLSGIIMLLFVLSKKLNEINILRKEVAKNQRLVSIGKLAAGVAHEIRNPLSSVKGFATYFKDKEKASPQDKEIADIMINEVNRLNRVVSQLLEFSTPVKLLKNRENLRQIIKNSLKLVGKRAKDALIKIEIKIDDDKNLESIAIDKDKISQALLNLYLNALDAMKNAIKQEGALSVSLKYDKEKNSVKVIVSDTGEGISDENLPHIFDPYFSTKPTGSGIGLANVHNIIKAHNGTIDVESRKEYGTKFIITLPNKAMAL
jgi:two-component system, NtrC family, sensor histidine kinase HydH